MTISPGVISPKFPNPQQGFQEPSAEDIAQLFASVNQLLAVSNAGAFQNVIYVTASGALAPQGALYVANNAGVLALTLAAPATDGIHLILTSNTAYAHTLTATGLLQTGSASVNVATFAAHPGASVELVAIGGKWNVISSNAITFS